MHMQGTKKQVKKIYDFFSRYSQDEVLVTFQKGQHVITLAVTVDECSCETKQELSRLNVFECDLSIVQGIIPDMPSVPSPPKQEKKEDDIRTMKTYICYACGEDRIKNPCMFFGWYGVKPTNCPSETKGTAQNWKVSNYHYVAREIMSEIKNDSPDTNDLDNDLLKAKIRAINASSEAKELRSKKEEVGLSKPTPERMIDYQILAWDSIKDINIEKLKKSSRDLLNENHKSKEFVDGFVDRIFDSMEKIEPVIPNCSLCKWNEEEERTDVDDTEKTLSHFVCIAQGLSDCASHTELPGVYNSDECKALYKVKGD